MTTAAYDTPTPHRMGWFSRTEAWMDARGKGAWIAAMVLGFVFFWPLGLALLGYLIWTKRLGGGSCARGGSRRHFHAMRSSGNSAFDAYRDETIRRLEDEQRTFEAFLERLREAKDKAEFDQFMEERERAAKEEREADDRRADA